MYMAIVMATVGILGRQSPWPSPGQDLHFPCSSIPHTLWCWHRAPRLC